jgi:hypothetical protein
MYKKRLLSTTKLNIKKAMFLFKFKYKDLLHAVHINSETKPNLKELQHIEPNIALNTYKGYLRLLRYLIQEKKCHLKVRLCIIHNLNHIKYKSKDQLIAFVKQLIKAEKINS